MATLNTYTPETVQAGAYPVISETGIVASGANAAKWSVVGKITIGTLTAAAKTGGNTGTGTCTLITAGAKTQVGVYRVRCITATASAGTFSVFAPDGTRLYDATASTGGVAYTSPHINFTLIAKAGDTPADFIVGDGFDITVAAGSGKYKLVNSANVDGSQNPVGILCEATTSLSKDVYAAVWLTGDYIQDYLVFGGSDTYATHKEALRKLCIFLKPLVGA